MARHTTGTHRIHNLKAMTAKRLQVMMARIPLIANTSEAPVLHVAEAVSAAVAVILRAEALPSEVLESVWNAQSITILQAVSDGASETFLCGLGQQLHFSSSEIVPGVKQLMLAEVLAVLLKTKLPDPYQYMALLSLNTPPPSGSSLMLDPDTKQSCGELTCCTVVGDVAPSERWKLLIIEINVLEVKSASILGCLIERNLAMVSVKSWGRIMNQANLTLIQVQEATKTIDSTTIHCTVVGDICARDGIQWHSG